MSRPLLRVLAATLLVGVTADAQRADAQTSECRRRPFQATVSKDFAASQQHTEVLTLDSRPARRLEIEFVSVKMTALTEGPAVFPEAIGMSTTLSGVTASHFLSVQTDNQYDYAIWKSPIAFLQQAKIYADANAPIQLTADMTLQNQTEGSIRIEWTISGQAVTAACWTDSQ